MERGAKNLKQNTKTDAANLKNESSVVFGPFDEEYDEIQLIGTLNQKHKKQLIDLVHFLSASSDEQQRKRYLDLLLKEI